MNQFTPFDNEFKFLLSYHYYKNQDLDAVFKEKFVEPYPQVFIDSGAYSAFSIGAEIDIKEYAAWLYRYKHLVTVYSNLDSIGNAAKTLENQKRLEDMGLRPLPVFHTGEPWSYLEHYIENYRYIALGGMVPYLKDHKKLMPWLIRSFKMAKDRSVYHGFGCTNFNIIKSLPWYSVDSTSWLAGVKFGQVSLFDNKSGSVITVSLGDYKNIYKHAGLIREHGFEPEHFADRKKNSREEICGICAIAYMRAEQWLRSFHGDIPIPDATRETQHGLNLYLAAQVQDIVKAKKGINLYLVINFLQYGYAYNVIKEKINNQN